MRDDQGAFISFIPNQTTHIIIRALLPISWSSVSGATSRAAAPSEVLEQVLQLRTFSIAMSTRKLVSYHVWSSFDVVAATAATKSS